MYIKWGILQIKRNIRSFSFWCVIAILLLTYNVCGYVEKEHSKELDVLLCSENSEIGDRVIDYLTEDGMEGYVYHVMDDRDQIYTSIAKGEATCAFVFTEDFDRAVWKMNPHGEVLLYQAVNTLDGYTLREVIYPAILSCSSELIFGEYLDEVEASEEAKEMVLAGFKTLMDEKSLKIYETVNLEADNERDGKSSSSGKLSFFIMIMLLLLMTLITVAEGFKVNRAVLRAMKKRRALLLNFETALINLFMFILPLLLAKILL